MSHFDLAETFNDAGVQFLMERRPGSFDSLYRTLCASIQDAETAIAALSLKLVIANRQKDNQVLLLIWSRDCDGVEGKETHLVDASTAAVSALLGRIYDEAEGPVSWRIVHPYDWPQARDAARSYFRDVHAELMGY